MARMNLIFSVLNSDSDVIRCPLESCKHSEVAYESANTFDKHVVTTHIEELNFDNDKLLYSCPFCAKRFQKIGPILRWHLKQHCYNLYSWRQQLPYRRKKSDFNQFLSKIQLVGRKEFGNPIVECWLCLDQPTKSSEFKSHMLSNHLRFVEINDALPAVGHTEPEIFDEENYESDVELEFNVIAFDQIDSTEQFNDTNGAEVKVEMVDEDDTYEVIEMDGDVDDTEGVEVDWEIEEHQYESGSFICQWEVGRFDPNNGLYGDPGCVTGQICGLSFTSRAEFVDHSRQHIDKYDIFLH